MGRWNTLACMTVGGQCWLELVSRSADAPTVDRIIIDQVLPGSVFLSLTHHSMGCIVLTLAGGVDIQGA